MSEQARIVNVPRKQAEIFLRFSLFLCQRGGTWKFNYTDLIHSWCGVRQKGLHAMAPTLLMLLQRLILPVIFWYFSAPVLIRGIEQSDINNMVSNLKVRYDVIDNLQTSLEDKKKTFRAQITLVNEGAADITVGDWALYLCSIRMIEEEHTAHNSQGFVLPGGPGINVTHINGCLFKFAPNKDFKTMKHNDSLVLAFNASFWCAARTDVMPNWYIASDGLQARTITSTTGEKLTFVGPFETFKNGNVFQATCTIRTHHRSD
ncbi:hypothetical protein OS493_016713 [Desmophyllum pertusum]|uniref:N-acetyl-beta-glucosaminidase n=1 Tax=Desmophyllum pertusum TaxID=174260 RepID=A0A9X0CTC7_9CNID|nr:hypothetical protein OS493_016713 [Desmophyllum pertusum]